MSALWNLTSYLYKIFRHRFPFSQILEAENKNLRKLLRTLTPPDSVLDLGTGHGNALKQFHAVFGSDRNLLKKPWLVALDFSFKMLKKINSLETIDLIQAEAANLPIKNKTISLILVIGVTEYLQNLPRFIAEITRILTPNGKMIISISPQNWIFYSRFLLGKKLFGVSEAAFAATITNAGLLIKQQLSSLMQTQFLIIRKPGASFFNESNSPG
jgi:ubiquinone/menaquinone biosynthesis C-methylase UbiE